MPEEITDERVLALARRMVRIKNKATEEQDLEAQWLADYSLRLVRATVLVLGHLKRLGGEDFMPTKRLERLLWDDCGCAKSPEAR